VAVVATVFALLSIQQDRTMIATVFVAMMALCIVLLLVVSHAYDQAMEQQTRATIQSAAKAKEFVSSLIPETFHDQLFRASIVGNTKPVKKSNAQVFGSSQ
jgi:Tfp pilus assembly protein PilV